jgi:KaiC/GvpD/RAD55 family RecA-like ATPase
LRYDDVFPGSSRLVEGALPASSLLLIGPSGVGKTVFCKQFVYDGLTKGDPSIYITTSESPQEIENSMNSFGFEFESYRNNRLFRIVDCHSWKTGATSFTNWVIANPGDLAVVSRTIENALHGLMHVRLVLDSITGLTSICSYDLTFFSKFLQITAARIKALNGNAVFVVNAEAHDQQFISYLRQTFDGTLEMKGDESGKEIKRLMRLFSLKGAAHKTRWIQFAITSHGIVIRNEVELRCIMCSRIIEGEPHFETVKGNKLSFDTVDCASTYKKLKSVYGENFE